MNSRQKEVLQVQLDSEKKTLQELKQVYKQAIRDCEQKIRELSARTDMENLQTIIYQKRYQEALKAQLEGVMASLQSDSYATVSDYLSGCYQDGYIGAMYDLHGQGIPIITPIDQQAVVQAVQTDSKLSSGLYERLGEDVTKLKKSIRAELSRGIVNGQSWNEIAGRLSKSFKNTPFSKAYNNSMRIVRTEGHRIQNQSAMDAQRAAKSKGADIVKQWNAFLDDITRETHRQLNGQLREVDEPFSIGGKTADAPGMFGDPAEDCNCRCVILQRAKWRLTEAELNSLKEQAKDFGLDKAKDFEDFKGKYLKAAEETVSASELDQKGREIIYKNWEEYRKKYLGYASEVDFAKLDSSIYDTVKLGRYKNTETVNRILNRLDRLSENFYSPLQNVKWMDKEESMFSSAFASSNHFWGIGSAEIRLNPLKFKEDGLKRVAELSQKGYAIKIPAGKEVEYLITHEYGHCILNIGEKLPTSKKNFVQADFSDVKKARKELESVYEKWLVSLKKCQDEYDKISKPLDKKLLFEGIAPTEQERKELEEARKRLDAVKISKYAQTSADEFVAEAFADVEVGNSGNSYSKEVYSIITKYFGKGDSPRSGTQKISEKRKISEGIFETFNNGKGDSIRPHSIKKNMNSSKIGAEILEYLQKENVSVKLCYGIDNPNDIYGMYDPFEDEITIYCDKTKTTAETSSTIIHESTHRKLGSKGTFEEEVECYIAECLHKKGELTDNDKDAIIKMVRANYPDLK